MIRLLMLLCAGGYIYSLGHNAAAGPSDGAPKPSAISSVAQAGAGWIAREVHEQTAWAAAAPAEAAAPAAAPGLRVVIDPQITFGSR